MPVLQKALPMILAKVPMTNRMNKMEAMLLMLKVRILVMLESLALKAKEIWMKVKDKISL